MDSVARRQLATILSALTAGQATSVEQQEHTVEVLELDGTLEATPKVLPSSHESKSSLDASRTDVAHNSTELATHENAGGARAFPSRKERSRARKAELRKQDAALRSRIEELRSRGLLPPTKSQEIETTSARPKSPPKKAVDWPGVKVYVHPSGEKKYVKAAAYTYIVQLLDRERTLEWLTRACHDRYRIVLSKSEILAVFAEVGAARTQDRWVLHPQSRKRWFLTNMDLVSRFHWNPNLYTSVRRRVQAAETETIEVETHRSSHSFASANEAIWIKVDREKLYLDSARSPSSSRRAASRIASTARSSPRIPPTFSQLFRLVRTELDDWFDLTVDYDSPLYIDPGRIATDKTPLWQGAIEHLGAFLTAATQGVSSRRIQPDEAFRFSEPREFGLGRTFGSNRGSGIGRILSCQISEGMIHAVNTVGQDRFRPESLPIFVQGVGVDRISDLIGVILRERFAQYTSEIVLRHRIPSARTRVRVADAASGTFISRWFDLPRSPNGEMILLVPQRFLRPSHDASLAVSQSDFLKWLKAQPVSNEQARRSINALITKRICHVQSTLESHHSVISTYLDSKQKSLGEPPPTSLMHPQSELFRSAAWASFHAEPRMAFTDAASFCQWLLARLAEGLGLLLGAGRIASDDPRTSGAAISSILSTLIELTGIRLAPGQADSVGRGYTEGFDSTGDPISFWLQIAVVDERSSAALLFDSNRARGSSTLGCVILSSRAPLGVRQTWIDDCARAVSRSRGIAPHVVVIDLSQ